MKTKHVITAICFLCISSMAFAQTGEKRMQVREQRLERVESMKVAYLTKKLNLDTESAQKFWPVYNEFNNQMKAIRNEHLQEIKEARQNWEGLTDKKKEELMQSKFHMEQAEVDLKKEYHETFKNVLSVDQVAKLYRAEEGFKKHLIREMRDHNRVQGKPDMR